MSSRKLEAATEHAYLRNAAHLLTKLINKALEYRNKENAFNQYDMIDAMYNSPTDGFRMFTLQKVPASAAWNLYLGPPLGRLPVLRSSRPVMQVTGRLKDWSNLVMKLHENMGIINWVSCMTSMHNDIQGEIQKNCNGSNNRSKNAPGQDGVSIVIHLHSSQTNSHRIVSEEIILFSRERGVTSYKDLSTDAKNLVESIQGRTQINWSCSGATNANPKKQKVNGL